MQQIRIRKAKIKDVPQIHKLINYYAEKGVVLPRSLSELYEHIRDYTVVEENGVVYGACALGICWEDLAEIRSLVVSEERKGKGYGIMLVQECINEAKQLGVKKVFVLTYVPEFFKKFGFKQIKKSLLPHKIWADCIKCPKFPDCDEIAMSLNLEEM
ncbi:MAG: N-acetyltransferase [Deltaproteobacteria bacterium]|nr:MAG: N-acetyltransferase [Deltaproteobacteria bacterium]